MKFLKSLVITFSLYSRVPMPSFIWEKEDKAYVSAALPFVGILIGAFSYAANLVCRYFELSDIIRVTLLIFIPLALSGGIHLDGFLDVSDALSSYGSREKKLEILKDPHIGAFAIINLIKLLALLIIGLAMIRDEKACIALAFSYVYSRIFASLALLTIKNARGEGMLYDVSAAGRIKRINIIILAIEFIVASISIIYFTKVYALIVLITAVLSYLYYVWKANKEFSGITGDTEGWFIVSSETFIALMIGILEVVLSWI